MVRVGRVISPSILSVNGCRSSLKVSPFLAHSSSASSLAATATNGEKTFSMKAEQSPISHCRRLLLLADSVQGGSVTFKHGGFLSSSDTHSLTRLNQQHPTTKQQSSLQNTTEQPRGTPAEWMEDSGDDGLNGSARRR